MRIIFQAAAVILVFGAAACNDADRSPEIARFSTEDVEFFVPAEILRSSRDGQAGFIRINDPDTPIERL